MKYLGKLLLIEETIQGNNTSLVNSKLQTFFQLGLRT
jgi:hypothetical protein